MKRHKLWEERASKLMKKLFENQGIEVSLGGTPPEQLNFNMPDGSVITADFVDDDGGYYDIYDQDGNHLNPGEPWWLERGIPSEEEIVKIFGNTNQ